jgi:hypothetical protein
MDDHLTGPRGRRLWPMTTGEKIKQTIGLFLEACFFAITVIGFIMVFPCIAFIWKTWFNTKEVQFTERVKPWWFEVF